MDDAEPGAPTAEVVAIPVPRSPETLLLEPASPTPPELPRSVDEAAGLPTFDPAALVDVETSPADVVLETYPLHPAAARLWGIWQAVMISVPTLPLLLVAGVWQGPWASLAIGLLGLLAWSIAARHLRRAVARFRCERFARGLRYTHGVWWQSEVFIPSARVQHTEVNQGPIARRYGIGKLKVFTAAVQLGALEIDGLAYSDAVLLRDRLLGRQGDLASEDPVATVAADAPDA